MMNTWIAGSTCAAAVLSLAVASAQTYPPTSDKQPTTRSTPSSERRKQTATTQRVTMTGCLVRGTDSRSAGWILSNATMAGDKNTASASGRVSDDGGIGGSGTNASQSGSPSNESTSGNRNPTTGTGVSESTSTGVGTSGTTTATGGIDTEAHGGGALGATDQHGGTVGAGATADVAGDSGKQSSNTGGTASYQLVGVRNPMQYANKHVEVIGTMSRTRDSGTQTLRVTSVRLLGDTCQ